MHLPFGEVETAAASSRRAGRSLSCSRLDGRTPAAHLTEALQQLRGLVPAALDEARLAHGPLHIWGTPRRLVIFVESLALQQPTELVVKARLALRL